MKKLIPLCVAGLLAYATQAQTTKGTLVLTGKLGYFQQKQDKGQLFETWERSNYTISPSIGKFVKDNLEIGASFYRYREEYEYTGRNTRNTNSTYGHDITYLENSVSLYVKQYRYLTDKLAVYGSISAGIGLRENEQNSSSKYEDAILSEFTATNNAFTVKAALSSGITFFPSDKVGLRASLGALVWNHHKGKRTSSSLNEYSTPESPYTTETPYTNNLFALDFSSRNLNLGISYFIGR